MAIMLPAWLARLYNLMGIGGGIGWTNANEDTATSVGDTYVTYASTIRQPVADAAAYAARAAGAVEGPAGEAMTAKVGHPEGALNNLADHVRGAQLMALLTGYVTPMALRTLKLAKIIDGASTYGELVLDLMVPGAEVAVPEALAMGRLTQNALTNGMLNLVMGGHPATPGSASDHGATGGN